LIDFVHRAAAPAPSTKAGETDAPTQLREAGEIGVAAAQQKHVRAVIPNPTGFMAH
jgi:hypothetical protein